MDALERYIHDLSAPEEPLLHELDRETNLRAVAPRMLSGHIQGRLLEMLVRMAQPQRVLEIGTFTGYSALSMAAGLEEGAELHTVEVDDELEELAQSYFDRSPHGKKIRLHIGSALDVAPALGGVFDLVGERARVRARRYGDQSFKAGERDNLADEMADVLWVLVCLANQTGVDLTAAVEANFAKKTARDRERHKENEKLK